MDAAGVFGAAKAGLPFDPMVFIKKPQVILRLISLLFSIIVFGCINSGAYNDDICLYALDSNACSFGVGIGVLAFLGSLALLVVDALFDTISNVKKRKLMVIVDLAFSGLWTFLWFVCFCYLTNKWSNTPGDFLEKQASWRRSNSRSAIVFSLFSVFLWGGITFFAVTRFRLGMQSAFQPASQIEDQVNAQHGMPYPTATGGAYPGATDMDSGLGSQGVSYTSAGVMPSHHPYTGQPTY
jgi:hypothetical protein